MTGEDRSEDSAPGARRAARWHLVAAVTIGLPACATAHAGAWSGSLAATSDYSERGLTLSDHGPALLGDLHYHWDSGWFAGLGAASVKRGAYHDRNAEVDAELGRSWAVGDDWSARAAVAHYAYPGIAPRRQYDYDEAALSLFWRGRASLGLAASPNRSADTVRGSVSSRPAYAFELSLREPLVATVAAYAGAGWREQPQLADSSYAYWNAGLGWRVESLELDVAYIGTDHRARQLFSDGAAVNRLVATLSWRF